MDKFDVFFRFYRFFGFIHQKNTLISAIIENLMNKIEKCANFNRKLGKLAIPIKDDYYINWKNDKI